MAKHILVTGGAGFIGCNAIAKYAKEGHTVTYLDNLSRVGSTRNLAWLQAQNLPNTKFFEGDVRDTALINKLFTQNTFDTVLHCAAQVAVTSSVQDPRHDHDVNVLGTLNVLEGLRMSKNPKAFFIFTSTNKVYGGLEELSVVEGETRYSLKDAPNGISETQNLDFHSPYGCSKGAADQYVRDYARIYGLNTVVFRQSCIYGPQQVGIEDQGWVAWFIRKAMGKAKVNVYGTGKQVRDLLFIDDLLKVYDLAEENMEKTRGQIYNIGGGPINARSVVEVLQVIKKHFPSLEWNYADWRPGDQKVYISDIAKAKRDFGWEPKVGADEGIGRLISWAVENHADLPPLP